MSTQPITENRRPRRGDHGQAEEELHLSLKEARELPAKVTRDEWDAIGSVSDKLERARMIATKARDLDWVMLDMVDAILDEVMALRSAFNTYIGAWDLIPESRPLADSDA